MTKSPNKRLGCVKVHGGEKAVLIHSFFHDKVTKIAISFTIMRIILFSYF